MGLRFGFLAVVVALAVPAVAHAHPDHDHRLYGTVISVSAQQLEIRDGADVITITLNNDTKYARGRQRIAHADVKVGDRVAVDVMSEFAPFTAKEVVVQEPKKSRKNTKD